MVDAEYDAAGQQANETIEMLHQARMLLREWLERYGGIDSTPRNYGPTVWVCRSCGAEVRVIDKRHPPEPFPHATFCKAEKTRAFLQGSNQANKSS